MQNLIRQSSSPRGEGSFRRPLLVVLIAAAAGLLCLFLAGPAGADDDDDDGGESVPRQVVVGLKPAVNVGYINRKYGTSTISKLPGGENIYLLKTPKRTNPAKLVGRIRNDPRVLYVELNFRTGTPEGSKQHRANPGGTPEPTSDATAYRTQYAQDTLNLPEAHAGNRGEGVVVAVIDTGVQPDHPEFAGKMVAGYDFVDGDRDPADVGDGRDNDFDGEPDEMVGHGTHVAGIVALAAPEAKIMPVRALDTEGRGTTFGIARAIKYATTNGADVVNLSLGSSRESDLLEDLIEEDDDDDGGSDAVFAAAAGNDNNAIEQHPAAEDDAIAVASVDSAKKKSEFSNFGGSGDNKWVSVAAPGTDIHAPFPQGRYATWSGTSMATPFVAGQAALVRSVLPAADAECAVYIIGATAQPLDDSDPTFASRLGGHADAGAAVEYARTTGCPPDDD